MGSKCITAVWIFLTITLACAITLSLLSPVWFKNEIKTNMAINVETHSVRKNDILSFGLLRYCKRYQLVNVLFKCQFYDIFNGMPSIAWIISGSLFSIGMLLFVLCVLLSIFGLCLRQHNGAKYRAGLAYIQSVGVVFLCIAVVLYPIGLNSHLVREVCGADSNHYYAGDCNIAWGYVLIIMAVSLTIFCPILGKFSINPKNDYKVTLYGSESDILTISPTSTTKVMTTV